jgi:hypothetical protein
MRSPVIKRQPTPRSGLLVVFPRHGSRRRRHPVACADVIATDRRRQHVAAPTRIETRPPSRWREQRSSRSVLCGLATSRSPHPVLFTNAAERGSFACEGRVRVRGRPRHPKVTSPSAEESERASNQRKGISDVEPTCSYACDDAVAQYY